VCCEVIRRIIVVAIGKVHEIELSKQEFTNYCHVTGETRDSIIVCGGLDM
jgi:hypothetical protein